MAQIFIHTDDRRLYRILSLLAMECGHTVGDTAPSLLITDLPTRPARFSAIPCLKIGSDGMARPFLHEEMKARITELLSGDAPPLLTPTEKRLFDALIAAAPNPVSREALALAAFGNADSDGMLNLYIHYLRKKIETDGKRRIFSSRGKGYYYA